jgi:cytochrome c553
LATNAQPLRYVRAPFARNAARPAKCAEQRKHDSPMMKPKPADRGFRRSTAYVPMKKLTYLLALAFAGAISARAADAAANWTEHCAKCHGPEGKGDTKMGKKLSIADLTDAKVQAKFTDADGIKAIKEGIKDKSDKVAMKPIEGLTEPEMKDLIAHVRTLKK